MKQLILTNFWTEFRQHVNKVQCPLEFKYDNEKDRWTKLRLVKPDPLLLLEPVRTKQIILAQIRFVKPDTLNIFESFYRNSKTDIESEIGSLLIWRNEPGKVVCTINLEESFDLEDEKKWEWAFNWIIEKANLLMAVFNPRLDGSSVTSSKLFSNGVFPITDGENPHKEDIDVAESQLRKNSDEIIGIETVLDQVEINFKKAGKPLEENWREVTKQNIKIWFRCNSMNN